MRHIKDDDGEVIETETLDLSGEEINVRNANGYGACDVQIELGDGIMTWDNLDKLKAAIALAENLWRQNG
jgi:hypothetical protein